MGARNLPTRFSWIATLTWAWILFWGLVLTRVFDGKRVEWAFCIVAATAVAVVMTILRWTLFEGRWSRFFVSQDERWPTDENEVRWWTTFAVVGVATVLTLVLLRTVWVLA